MTVYDLISSVAIRDFLLSCVGTLHALLVSLSLLSLSLSLSLSYDLVSALRIVRCAKRLNACTLCCYTVLLYSYITYLTDYPLPVVRHVFSSQADVSSKLFSLFELLIAMLLTAIVSSAVTFLVTSLFMGERPFRLCRRAQNKQRSLRAKLSSSSNSIFSGDEKQLAANASRGGRIDSCAYSNGEVTLT
jgi:hypothetical protein